MLGAVGSVSITQLADRPPLGGTVVVVDVVRAFATSGALVAAGADRIRCVETLEAARALRTPQTVLVGEDGGYRPADFDHGNSPRNVPPLHGRQVVQRTSNGTRGLARASGADAVLAMAATNVSATARWLLANGAPDLTVLCTGRTSEDVACARALRAILRGERFVAGALSAAVLASGPEHAIWPEDWFRADVEVCAEVDRYDQALVGEPHDDGSVTLRAVHSG